MLKRLRNVRKKKSNKNNRKSLIKKPSKKQSRKQQINNNRRIKCSSRTQSGIGMAGDLYNCSQGTGMCRKLKRHEQYSKTNTNRFYVKCKKKNKKCSKGYMDCSGYDSI